MDNEVRYAKYGAVTYYGDIDVIIEMFGEPDHIGIAGDEKDVKPIATGQDFVNNERETIQELLENELSRI